jgi:hypothetical protein
MKGEDVPEGSTFIGNPARAVVPARQAAPAVALPGAAQGHREVDRETVALRRFSRIRSTSR